MQRQLVLKEFQPEHYTDNIIKNSADKSVCHFVHNKTARSLNYEELGCFAHKYIYYTKSAI